MHRDVDTATRRTPSKKAKYVQRNVLEICNAIYIFAIDGRHSTSKGLPESFSEENLVTVVNNIQKSFDENRKDCLQESNIFG